MNKQINLRISEQMYRKLQAQLKRYSYSSVQEVILDAVREKYFRHSQVVPGAKRGRPKEENGLDRLKILGRKRIFG